MRKFFISSAAILLILMHALCNSAVEKLHALVLVECSISIVGEEWLIGPSHFTDGHSSFHADRLVVKVALDFHYILLITFVTCGFAV
ncbi:neurochondrin family protein [Perilla frutescens var. hirtella]|nr:neurochondrin family protein [Perilla frutescens var. hirtella]